MRLVPPGKMQPINPDAELENADWNKQTWDLPTNEEDLQQFLDAVGISREDFERLPAAQGRGRPK